MIPSAKVVNSELQSLYGSIPSLLLPYKEGNVLEYLYNKYIKRVDKIILLVHDEKEKIYEFVNRKNLFIEICDVDQIVDLGYSIKTGLKYLDQNIGLQNIEKLVINFGDTIVDSLLIDMDLMDDSFFYAITDDCGRWTTFYLNSNSELKIIDKEYNDNLHKYNTFVGLYVFSNTTLLLSLLEKKKSDKIDSFYYALKKYSGSRPLKMIETEEWYDVGHIDMLYDAQRDVKERYFNSIAIDKRRGILIKNSDHKMKLINEIQWYLKIPKGLQYICPRIFDYSLDYNTSFISMEYYGYSTLHDLFVYSDIDIEMWKKIFLRLISVLEDMENYKLMLPESEIRSSLYDMYVTKTFKRLTELKSSGFPFIYDQSIIINNMEFNSLNYYINKIPELMDMYEIYNTKHFNIIHGDLCLSNILYEKNSELIRLIDPRGSFGNYDIYGDQRYDIAKLAHSVIGKYDLIIKDLFTLQIDGNEISFSFYNAEKYKEIENIFLNFLKKYNYNSEQIMLIQALLFLSMIPLHSDYPKRQYAMLATGINILDKIMERTFV